MSQKQLLPEVILALPRKDDDRVVTLSTIATAVENSAADFPTSGPIVLLLKAGITPYAKAIADAKNKIPGAVEVRREARTAVGKVAEALRLNIQGVVDANVDTAATLTEKAKMKLRKIPKRFKAAFAVKDALPSGSVELIVKAVRYAILYFWEFSVDNKVFVTAPDTTRAATIISGLTVGQMYYFRFRTRTRTGMTDYSQTLTHVVR